MSPELEQLLARHLPVLHVGKVRNTYRLEGQYMGRPLRLSVKTNRWSIFDFKLGTPNSGQAEILNAFDIAARLHLHKVASDIATDLVAYGPGVDKFVPHELHDNPELQCISTVIEGLGMVLAECVGRNYATGTFYKAYREAKGRPVWGHQVPPNLPEGFAFTEPIFTPTTKAQDGHDEPLNHQWFRDRYGPLFEPMTLRTLSIFTELAQKGGVMLVDSKFELGRRIMARKYLAGEGRLMLADEVVTPHSSRFWLASEYRAAYPARIPPSMDKQAGREWGKAMGIDRLDPKNSDDQRAVFEMQVPLEVMEKMNERAATAFSLIYGKTVQQFQRQSISVAI